MPGIHLADDLQLQLEELNGKRCMLEDHKKFVGNPS